MGDNVAFKPSVHHPFEPVLGAHGAPALGRRVDEGGECGHCRSMPHSALRQSRRSALSTYVLQCFGRIDSYEFMFSYVVGPPDLTSVQQNRHGGSQVLGNIYDILTFSCN